MNDYRQAEIERGRDALRRLMSLLREPMGMIFAKHLTTPMLKRCRDELRGFLEERQALLSARQSYGEFARFNLWGGGTGDVEKRLRDLEERDIPNGKARFLIAEAVNELVSCCNDLEFMQGILDYFQRRKAAPTKRKQVR